MKIFKHLSALVAVLVSLAALHAVAGPGGYSNDPIYGNGNGNYDVYDDPHGDSSSSSEMSLSLTAVQNATLNAIDKAEGKVWDHLDNRSAAGRDGNFGMWLTPYYEHSHSKDLVGEGVTVRRNSGGSGFGMDFDIGNLLLGGAFDVGYSKVTVDGGFTKSKTESEFYSFMGYGDWQSGALRLYGALGFGYDLNELKMDMGGGYGKSRDFNTLSLSTAFFGEYTFSGIVDVSPYAGIRYAYINSDGCKLGGISFDPKDQHIARFPVGVKVTKDFKVAGFFLRPGVNCYVEPVVGDTDTKTEMHSRSMGINQTDEARMTDDFHWHATAGVTFGFEAFVLSLNYGYHGSGHENKHGFSLSYNMVF